MKSELSSWLTASVIAAALAASGLTGTGVPAEHAQVLGVERTNTEGASADQSRSGEIASIPVNVGIANAFKVGHWTPVAVMLGPARPDMTQAGRAQLEVDAPDPEGSLVTYRSAPTELTNIGPNRLSVLIKLGRLEGTLQVRVVAGGRTLLSRKLRVSADRDGDLPPPYRESVFLIGHVHPIGDLAAAERDARATALVRAVNASLSPGSSSSIPRTRVEVIDLGSSGALPADVRSYDGMDAILFNGRLDVDAGRSEAIQQWVRAGGHLVITAGASAPSVSQSPLAKWLPIKVRDVVPLRDLSSVESFCHQSARITSGFGDRVDAARLREGQVLIRSLEGPLLSRAPYGLGRVTIFGIDIEDPHMMRWNALGEMLRRLFDFDDPQLKQSRPVTTRLTQTGITEVGTQLDATQDEFPSVSTITTWPVMTLLVVLLLVVGPLDFLLVHKLLKRPELTWVTFPLFAVLAAAGAILWGTWHKGDRLLLNQLDVFDVDLDSGAARINSYGLVYSPENGRFNVSGAKLAMVPTTSPVAKAASPVANTETALRLSWHGRAESSFGGMYRAGGAEIVRPAYSEEPGSRTIDEVPIAIWSTKALEADWRGQHPGIAESQLTSRGSGRLEGTLRHHFSEPIEDWVLAYGHQVFYPRENQRTHTFPAIPPEISWSPQSALQRELSGFLTGATQVTVKTDASKYDELRTEHADYDPLNRNATDVMRMLTFHTEAGGSSYTGLANGALRNFDLTPLLELNRAVLFGRLRRPATEWKIDGTLVEPSQNATFVRLVLPVRLTQTSNEDQP